MKTFHLFIILVFRARQSELRAQQMIGSETEINLRQPLKASHRRPAPTNATVVSATSDHQHAAGAAARASRGSPGAFLERLIEIEP